MARSFLIWRDSAFLLRDSVNRATKKGRSMASRRVEGRRVIVGVLNAAADGKLVYEVDELLELNSLSRSGLR